MSERLEMKCKRCGDNEDRTDGFCSIECRDKFYLEEDITELTTRIAELEVENAELKERVAMLDVTAVFKSLGEMGYIEQTNKLHARIAELEEAQRWIPVSERLPEEYTPVLTLSKDNDKPVTAFLYAGFWWSNVDWALNVTHWMPLPQLPEEREE